MPDALIPETISAERRSRRRAVLIATGAVVAVIAVAAVLYSAISSTHQPSGTNPNESHSTAPALTAHTLSGEAVTVAGARPAVLLFFSVECGSCGPSAQALAQAQGGVPNADFVAVDIARTETDAEVKDFLTDNRATGLAYTIDTDARWAIRFNVNQLSTAVVVDANGKEVFRAVEPSAEQLQTALRDAAA